MPQLEICCYSLQSCLNAQAGGADRIELCNGLFEGGTTPSVGLIQLAAAAVRIPVYVIVRPRGGDFVYTETELAVMETDILAAKAAGAAGIVIGCLCPDGTVDVATTRRLVELSAPLGVTFHRAFDMTIDPFAALEDIIAAGCERILTSGQANYAAAGEALLRRLVEQAAGRIEIMAGSGIGVQNAAELVQTGVDALHLSAKVAIDSSMEYRNEAVSMASALNPSEYVRYEADTDIIRRMGEIVKG